MRTTQDDRGQSFWDVFDVLPGQVNISRTLPKQKRGFHLHKKKTDYWFLLEGKQLVILYDELEDKFRSFTMNAGDSLTIAPGLWHGYMNIGEEPSLMVYYETAKSGPEREDDYEMSLEKYREWPV